MTTKAVELSPLVQEKEDVPCLLCGIWNKKPLYTKRPFVVKCRQCGFIYTTPRLKPEFLEDFYSREYFKNHTSEEMGYDNYVSDKRLVRKTFLKRLLEIQSKWLPSMGRVLDVGCAAGFFLAVARGLGWEPHGVEISNYCCDYAKREFNLDIHQGTLVKTNLTPGTFDLVTMWDYIEHTPTAKQDIRKAHQLLKPNGILALTTPDVESLPAKIFRDKWMGFKEYEHIYYFNSSSLSALLEENGFKVIRKSAAGKFVSMDFFLRRLALYSASLSKTMRVLLSKETINTATFYCNPFDITYLTAQKISPR